MKISFFLGIKNLFAYKKLAFLLIAIIGLSFVNLTFFNSLNNGIREVTNNKLEIYAFSDLRILPKENEEFIEDTPLILNKLRRLNDIEFATQRLIFQEVISDGDIIYPTSILGIELYDELLISQYSQAIKKGEFISKNNKGVVLGDEIVGNLDGTKSNMDFKPLNLDIGSKLFIQFNNGIKKEYKVQGIFDTLFWVTDFNMIMNIDELRTVYNLNEDYSSEILIKLKDGADKESVKKSIYNNGINYRVVDSIEDLGIADTILESQKVTTILANIIGIFSTFITVFIIIFISVSNNKKQLGILKAVGISEKRIINSYLIQSFFYAIFGVLFGLLFLYFVILYLKANPIKLPMGYFYPIVGIKDIMLSAIIILVSSIVAGYFASSKIIKSNIVSVLRGL